VSRARRRRKASSATARRVGRQRAVPPDVDFFGLEREARVAASEVRHVFTPHQPISEVELLFGRQEEVSKLVQTLGTPGQHVLLYGERGVGKSSLANVVANVLLSGMQLRQFVKRCDRSDIFETILREPLEAVGADLALIEVASTKRNEFKLGAPVAGTNAAKDIVRKFRAIGSLSPSTVAAALTGLEGVLIIDEFDAIALDDDRERIAELIKHLSDSGASLKVMVVGIAETAYQLTAAHPSVQRCLRETKLRRMRDGELGEIVTTGAKALGLVFDDSVVKAIVQLSAGYPHFTHLLALKCAEAAIGDCRNIISDADLTNALQVAVSDAEGTLKKVYDDSVRSQQSDMYGHIVAAAASLTADEFTSSELRTAVQERTGEPISQYSLNNYFQRLMSEEKATILQRTAKGVYRFSDPRMRSYVRIVNHMT
jgi:Cdc6-like AAA superfamily ATPase